MTEHTHTPDQPRVMLVTGASSGIGEATARRLAREPQASLVLVARREERLKELAAALGDERVSWLAADLLDSEAPERIRDHVLERHGRLDLLVNNAGAAWHARFADGGYENVAAHHGHQLRRPGAADRGAAPSAAGLGAERDRQRVLHGRAPGARRERRLQRVEVRPRRLVGRAAGRGAGQRRARRAVLPGFISTEGFPSPS